MKKVSDIYKNKELLEAEYLINKMPQRDICKKYNLKGRTLRRYLNLYNIKQGAMRTSWNNGINKCDISPDMLEFIEGELLGDMCIVKAGSVSGRIQYHSVYLEYIKYLTNQLRLSGIKCSKITTRHNNIKGRKFTTYGFASMSYKSLLDIRKKWYPDDKKIVPRTLILTPTICKHWYIGDGSVDPVKSGNDRVRLSTQGFNTNDVNFLVKLFGDINIKSYRQKNNTLNLSRKDTKKFLRYIGKCPVECYKYKWRTLDEK